MTLLHRRRSGCGRRLAVKWLLLGHGALIVVGIGIGTGRHHPVVVRSLGLPLLLLLLLPAIGHVG